MALLPGTVLRWGRGQLPPPKLVPCPKSLITAVVKTANSYTGGRFLSVGVVDLVVWACVLRPTTKNKVVNSSVLLPKYFPPINQSINQYIYNAPWYGGACYSADYAEAKRNVLSRVLNVITDGACYYRTVPVPCM